MNERDKELAKQAKGEYCELDNASCFKRLNLVEAIVFTPTTLSVFADLIRADEREAIAAWLDGESGKGRIISCTSAAKAIRARSNT
jgi:hypothetical protein